MVILDTNHISILERRGPDAYPLLTRLAAIPISDVRVTVISYAVLLTRNERDFRNIAGLKMEDWTR